MTVQAITKIFELLNVYADTHKQCGKYRVRQKNANDILLAATENFAFLASVGRTQFCWEAELSGARTKSTSADFLTLVGLKEQTSFFMYVCVHIYILLC